LAFRKRCEAREPGGDQLDIRLGLEGQPGIDGRENGAREAALPGKGLAPPSVPSRLEGVQTPLWVEGVEDLRGRGETGSQSVWVSGIPPEEPSGLFAFPEPILQHLQRVWFADSSRSWAERPEAGLEAHRAAAVRQLAEFLEMREGALTGVLFQESEPCLQPKRTIRALFPGLPVHGGSLGVPPGVLEGQEQPAVRGQVLLAAP